jgi:hypothetical protein
MDSLHLKRILLHVGKYTSEWIEFEAADNEALYPVVADVELYNYGLLEEGIDDERFVATATYLPTRRATTPSCLSCHRTRQNHAFLESLVARYGAGSSYASLPLEHHTRASARW